MAVKITEIPKDVEIQAHLTSIRMKEWMKEDVFRLKWWLLIGLLLLLLFLWWKTVDKTRSRDVCLFAAIAVIFAIAIREYGQELTLWDYPTAVIPIFPPSSSINLIGLPLIYSIVFQYCRTWKSFILVTLIVTAVICFILEPLFVLAGLYQLVHWKHYYSYPVYLVMAISTRAAVNKINVINKKHVNEIRR